MQKFPLAPQFANSAVGEQHKWAGLGWFDLAAMAHRMLVAPGTQPLMGSMDLA